MILVSCGFDLYQRDLLGPDLIEELQGEGYGGAYDSVQRAVKAWKQSQRRSASTQAFIPLLFAPGEAACRSTGAMSRSNWAGSCRPSSWHTFA